MLFMYFGVTRKALTLTIQSICLALTERTNIETTLLIIVVAARFAYFSRLRLFVLFARSSDLLHFGGALTAQLNRSVSVH